MRIIQILLNKVVHIKSRKSNSELFIICILSDVHPNPDQSVKIITFSCALASQFLPENTSHTVHGIDQNEFPITISKFHSVKHVSSKRVGCKIVYWLE